MLTIILEMYIFLHRNQIRGHNQSSGRSADSIERACAPSRPHNNNNSNIINIAIIFLKLHNQKFHYIT